MALSDAEAVHLTVPFSTNCSDIALAFGCNSGGHTMNSRTLILAAVLVIVVAAGYFYMMPQTEMMQPEPATTSQTPNSGTQ